jgi:hypothetical protein
VTETTGTCGSCGRESADVEPVRRVYVTPERWDTEASAEMAAEVERWCFSCRSMYPHVVAEGEGEDDERSSGT